MGTRGPVPGRSGSRVGHPQQAMANAPTITKGVGRKANGKVADPNWHQIAQDWYNALKKSGQADFYQASDWAFAYSLADDLSEYKRADKRSSMMLASIMQGMSLLLTTEGDRRRVNIELHEPEDTGSKIQESVVADYEKALYAKNAPAVANPAA